VRDAASLVASKHFLPHSPDWLYGYKPGGPYSYTPNYSYSPMALGGLMSSMGSTGDRPEIGPVTLPQADFILLGTPLAKTVMMAQAEACASLPFHLRDEKTGAWLDNRAHPYYSFNQNVSPKVPVAPNPQSPNFMFLNAAHMPQLTYVPYMLTDDPYLLEELQATALYHVTESNYHQTVQKLPGIAQPSEQRGMAWGVRDIALAAKATPASVPGWLLPKSLWLANFADNRTFIQRFMDSPALTHKVFRTFPRADSVEGFEMDYMMIAFAWVVRIGFAEWSDAYAWTMGGVLPQVTDGSGWLKGWPDPYMYRVFINPGAVSLIKDTSRDAGTFKTWAEAFQGYVADKGNINPGDPTLANSSTWDGISIVQTQSSAGYFFWRQGQLHLAVGLNVAGADAASKWLDSQMPAVIQRLKGVNDPRFSFGAN
jgi:hypothetical protein